VRLLDKPKIAVVVRVRGPSGVDAETEYTLRLLNLKRTNHATILALTPSTIGMLMKVRGYVTWGEVTAETLSRLLARADPLPGVSLGEELRRLGVNTLDELAAKIVSGKMDCKVLRRLFKPVLRLHPPRGGFKGSIKKPIGWGGVLGYAGKRIEGLLKAMC